MTRTGPTKLPLREAFAVGVLAVAAAGQEDLLQALRGGRLTPGGAGAVPPPNLLGPNLQAELYRYVPGGYLPRNNDSPMLRGLPILPPPQFKAYPGGRLPIPFLDQPTAAILPTTDVPRSINAWPAWFDGPEAADAEGFTAGVAIVAQLTDYVWIRADEDGPTAPLIWFDRFRVVESGTSLSIRGGGHALLAFNDGTRLQLDGRCEVRLRELDTDAIDLEIPALERIELLASERPLRAALGAGGTFELARTRAVLRRDGDFVVGENRGPGEIRLQIRGRSVLIPPGFHATIRPEQPVDQPSTALRLDGGVRTGRDGRDLLVEAPDLGAVEWNGARFDIPVGGRLRIDPLAGESFPDHRTTDG